MSTEKIGGDGENLGNVPSTQKQTRSTADHILYGVLGLLGVVGTYGIYDNHKRESFFDDTSRTRALEVCLRNAQYAPEICTPPKFEQTVKGIQYGFVIQGLSEKDTIPMSIEGLQALTQQYVQEMLGGGFFGKKSFTPREKQETIDRLLAERKK